jgi:hypothetical protein
LYRIDKNSNSISPLHECSFSELGFRERAHLQEWIANEPAALGEELLIIQKEFAGFTDTQERLDLLALDKQGSLVIIENKLDDTGRDVTWQALKYASYCASMTKDGIRKIYQEYLDKHQPGTKAEERLSAFFDNEEFAELVINKGVTQRIILVAAQFRKEVTSTVLWLSSFKLRMQCFRVTPYSMDDELFLSIEQIIPTKDAEDFMIGLADKAQDEIGNIEAEKLRHKIRREFWSHLISAMNLRSPLYQNISPGTQSWIGSGSGVRGIGFNFSATKSYARAELYIDRGSKAENEFVFDRLINNRAEIERTFGADLTWERLELKRACRIKAEADGDIFERDRWPEMIEYMVDMMLRLEQAFRGPLQQISRALKSNPFSQGAVNGSKEIVDMSE